jgi:hypothetical protein
MDTAQLTVFVCGIGINFKILQELDDLVKLDEEQGNKQAACLYRAFENILKTC